MSTSCSTASVAYTRSSSSAPASYCPSDLAGLRAFCDDYPMAKPVLLYGGTRRYHDGPIEIWPIEPFLRELPEYLT